ncbi:hypothetical protein AB0B66_11890 [Catellatospora sp. NPDC049111]|uniref:hypothetical protein n=1 Tax=Catellatospora sp. NPDC049111 TaxID=3155271 RepID=UPI00340F9B2A
MYRTRRLTLVAAMIAGALTPAVAASASNEPAPSYAAAPCPKPNIPELGPSADLPSGITCGYLTVPEDRSRPDSRMIRVAVAHAKAVSATPKPDPIVFLTHGPGGVAFLDAVREVGAGMNADRDVYFVAQRGNYHSDPQLTCPDYDRFADGTALGLKFAAPSTGAQNLAAVKACRDKLAATGAHLASYNTVENAADIADLRTALGSSSGTSTRCPTARTWPRCCCATTRRASAAWCSTRCRRSTRTCSPTGGRPRRACIRRSSTPARASRSAPPPIPI